MIKSKIHRNWYLWVSLMIFLIIFGFITYILKSITYMLENGIRFSEILIIFFFISLETFLIVVVKDFKYLIIDIQKNRLKYYSIFRPFGKTLYFKDYIGTYQTTETGSAGSYKVLYLVDKNSITRFKLMGLYYKNFDEIVKAIPLQEIRRGMSPQEYFKLLFTGRVNLSKIKDKKNSENKIISYLKVFIVISFLIFIIGMIIKILSKL